MKKIILTLTMVACGMSLASCSDDEKLTKAERCDQIQRQIAMYQQPNPGYSWRLAQMKIQDLKQQAETIGC